MYSLLLVSLTSFLVALLLTPVVRNLSLRAGWLDRPDAPRKRHAIAVPRIGGVAIAAAYLLSFAILLLSPLAGGEVVKSSLGQAAGLLPAAGLVFLLGLADDLFRLKVWQKLCVQIAAAALAILGGVVLRGIGSHELSAWVAIPATVLWLLACTNAFNLIDGVDGLAAGVGLFATITTLIAALQNNSFGLAVAIAPLAGALLGFLRYNFNPATIFLGDSGSLTVGFLLGCYGVLWSHKAATLLGMTAPLMALSIPLLDTGLAIARRFLRRQSIFEGDRGHIHHRLLDRGLTPRKVALLLYGVGGLAATLSLIQNSINQSYGGVILILFCLIAWVGVQHLGYVEFGVAGRMFVEGAFRRMLNANISIHHLERSLSSASTWAEVWDILVELMPRFGCIRMDIEFDSARFIREWSSIERPPAFHVRLEIQTAGLLMLNFRLDDEWCESNVTRLLNTIRGVLIRKGPELSRNSSSTGLEVVRVVAAGNTLKEG